MAAYAATVADLLDKVYKIDNVVGIGIYVGTVTISNYNQTGAEITGITGKFKQVLAVIAAPTSGGYVLRWNATDECFDALNQDLDGGPLVEVASDTNLGSSRFIAIGLI